MQNLGLSDSTPQMQGRLKSLAWPSIGNEYDVEYLTRQGFSICVMIALFTSLATFAIGPVALLMSLFYYLAGVGIRVRSRFAAVSVFVMFLLNSLPEVRNIQPMFFVKLVLLAVLGTNTFLAAKWAETQTEPPPMPISGSFMDNFGDLWPRKIWPIGQYIYYVMSGLLGLLLVLGAVALIVRPRI
jgi:hypothetical protein